MAKLAKMTRYVPGLYKPETNPMVKGLLFAWSSEDDFITQAIEDAKDQIYVKTAQFQYLDALGSNVGVFRPSAIGLADAQYRELIPALSFFPKQVVPTVKKVLGVFFGVGNPLVKVNEINPNEIVIQIPASVPALRRSLKGSHHFHDYAGTVVSVDNIGKTVTVNIGITKVLTVDEIKNAFFGVGNFEYPILSNAAGKTNVIIQFAASLNLSSITAGSRFNVAGVKNYPGSFVPNKISTFTVTKKRGILGQALTAGMIFPTVTMSDASGIPDATGKVVFNYGMPNQEGPINYFGRPNNSTILLDPSYVFTKDHTIGEVVNVSVLPYKAPRIDGSDYSVYLVGVEAARILAQQIVENVLAVGIVVRWIVIDPKC